MLFNFFKEIRLHLHYCIEYSVFGDSCYKLETLFLLHLMFVKHFLYRNSVLSHLLPSSAAVSFLRSNKQRGALAGSPSLVLLTVGN